MNTQSSFRHLMIVFVSSFFFLCISLFGNTNHLEIPAVSPSADELARHSVTNAYIVIGKAERCEHIKWSGIEPSQSEASDMQMFQDGKTILTVKTSIYRHMALILENLEIFALTEKEAVKMNTDKQTVLILGKRRGMMTEARFKEAAGRVVSLDKRFLYYADRFEAPEGLIKKYKLEDSVLFQDQEKDMPKVEGTREFDLELKKYGITLSQNETNIVSQIPPDACDDLPVGAVDGVLQPDEAAPE